ncbi:MAG TPA: hypothetical protein VHB27_17125, partial [Rhodopila sp.]|uniref:hypothetical protein n=1 Tax=Rhodopila sp. TaxID=2480087 RepID=UPI002BF14286
MRPLAIFHAAPLLAACAAAGVAAVPLIALPEPALAQVTVNLGALQALPERPSSAPPARTERYAPPRGTASRTPAGKTASPDASVATVV